MTGIVNEESVLFSKSSRLLETRPLRVFIITSIYSFIACISTKIGGGVISIREGMLKFSSSGLLGSLLPFGISGPPPFGAVPLVFLLDVVSCVQLRQLLLQIVILFREAFHRSHEGLDLSF